MHIVTPAAIGGASLTVVLSSLVVVIGAVVVLSIITGIFVTDIIGSGKVVVSSVVTDTVVSPVLGSEEDEVGCVVIDSDCVMLNVSAVDGCVNKLIIMLTDCGRDLLSCWPCRSRLHHVPPRHW